MILILTITICEATTYFRKNKEILTAGVKLHTIKPNNCLIDKTEKENFRKLMNGEIKFEKAGKMVETRVKEE